MDYMSPVLKGVPMAEYRPPNGVVTAKINSATGFRESSGDMTEFFFSEQLPPLNESTIDHTPKVTRDVQDQLF
jgi:penicillin-binding protein 1A